MKYVGYILYLLVFFGATVVESGRKFFTDSLELAPEITLLVTLFYLYNVGLTVIVSILPNRIQGRANFYNVHIKMSCSVMVSLGLVGTFLGLVDMISGIGAALSGGEEDFAKRMATLLGAISASLGAMAFAFMTSILGVGLSAYSMVAATFVGSDLVARLRQQQEEEKAEDEWQILQAQVEKEEKAKIKAAEDAKARAAEMIPLVTNIMDTTFMPLAERLERMESKQIELLDYLISDNPLKNRLETIENKLISMDLGSVERQLTPLMLIDTLESQQSILAEHNQQVAESLHSLSTYQQELGDKIGRVAEAMEGYVDLTADQTQSLAELQGTLKENSNALSGLETSLTSSSDKVKSIAEKLKQLFG